MKSSLTRDEVLSKIRHSLSVRLGQALEAMTGLNQRCEELPDFDSVSEFAPGESLLGWMVSYSAGPSVQLRIFATSKDWRLIATTVLEAAGVEDMDDPTLESTYTETLAQAASAWSQDLSGLAGAKWESTGSATTAVASDSLPTWAYRLPIESGAARLMVQVSSELLDALLQTGEEETAAPKQAATGEVVSGKPQFDLLLDVELPLSVSFGRSLVPLKEVLKLSSGSIVELNRAVTEPVEVIINNCVIARGEVVVVEGNYGVRIQQIISRQDRLRTMN